MRIAIIGSGIAGLGAARALGERHDVEIFEADSRPGGHTHTIDTRVGGRQVPVDTGFIIYNERTYPRFTRLLDELGVITRPTEMSFGVTCERCQLDWGSAGLAALFAQPRNLVRPRHYAMLAEIVRFFRVAHRELGADRDAGASGALERESLGDFLARHHVSADAAAHFLVPMGAAIWSTPAREVREFPAATYLRFFANHGMLGLTTAPRWRTIVGGSRTYVTALLGRLPASTRLHLSTPIARIRRDDTGVTLELVARGGEGARAVRFDRVIVATHSDTALRLLDEPTADERRVLGALGYLANDTVLHTDETFLPRRRAAWSAWNYRVRDCAAADAPLSATYWMNRLQGLPGPTNYLVTLNPARPIDPARVLARIDYAHPRFDFAAIQAQRELAGLQGQRRTWFAGAYAYWGFHEDGLRAGIEAAQGAGAIGMNGAMVATGAGAGAENAA